MQLIIQYEPLIRLFSFLFFFTLLWFWQRSKPYVIFAERQSWAELQNLALMFVGVVLMRVVLPVTAVVAAQWAEAQGVGVMNLLALPLWLKAVLAILLLDMLIYWQHRVMHLVPWLWRLHRVHHADAGMDVSTALRFHPVEMVLSMLYKVLVVVLLGVPFWVVVIFESLLNVSAMFNHTNIALPARIDKQIMKLVVTPSMHRIHHSQLLSDSNTNYGFFLSCWDRWFKSFSKPSEPEREIDFGIARHRAHSVWQMLILPLRK